MDYSKSRVKGVEKLLLHLYKHNRFRDMFEVPPALTQEGIAKEIGIAQQNVSTFVRKLETEGLIDGKTSHIQGMNRRKKAYFLTEAGIIEARALEKRLQLSRYIDFADQIPDMRYFFGREAEISRFNEWMKSDTYKVLVVQGMAGIGKTVYINKSIRLYRSSMHTFWHRFSDWSTLRSAVTRLADFLNELGKDSLSINLQTKETIDLNEVSMILEKDLIHLNALLIFDNYSKVKDDKELTQFFGAIVHILEQTDGVKLIVIGREVPRFFYDEREVIVRKLVMEICLEGLDRESSLELLEMRGISESNVEELYELTAGHPLSLELISGTGQFETQDNIKRFIEDEIISHLTPRERELLEIASVFRYPIYITAYLSIAGGYKLEVDPMDHDVINSLVKKSLIQISGGIGDTHDLLKEFFYTRLPDHTRKRYHEKVAMFYMGEVSETTQATIEVLYHLIEAEEYQHAAKLSTEAGRKLIGKGHSQEFLKIMSRLPMESIESQYISEILLFRGDIHNMGGQLDKAVKDYRSSIKLFKETGNKLRLAEANRKIGTYLMWGKNQPTDAMESYKLALELSQEIDDARGVGEAYRNMGRISWRKGDYDAALESLNKSLEWSRKVNARQTIAKTYLDIGGIHGERGDYETSIEYLTKSLSLLEEMEERYEISRVCTNIGVTYHHMGKWKDTIQWYEKAIKIAEDIGSIRGLGFGLSNAAEVYINLDDLDKALEYCTRADLIFTQLDDKYMIANNQMVFGVIHTKKNNWNRAKDYFTAALDISSTGGSPDMNAQIHLQYGKMLVEAGDIDNARSQFNSAYDTWKKIGNESMVKKVEEEIGQLG